MDTTDSGAQARLVARLKQLRAERGLSLEALADRARVSRSMISLVERGKSSPTAAVLDRLSAGLGVTMASLFADERREEASPISRRAEQEEWRDPGTGFVRRQLSPSGFTSPITLIEICLPKRTRAAFDTPGRRTAVSSQQIYVAEGALELTISHETYKLGEGDCMAMRLADLPSALYNPARRTSRYIIAFCSDPKPLSNDSPTNGRSTH
jgi:transcriptional regulator with XRE-family HTH domain